MSFKFFLDTYFDKQNRFVFRLSAAGVQQDERLSNGDEDGDIGWDAVWASGVKCTKTVGRSRWQYHSVNFVFRLIAYKHGASTSFVLYVRKMKAVIGVLSMYKNKAFWLKKVH
jgi:hypothetical protein